MPCSCALSMIAWASDSGVIGPKFMVPRQSRLTRRPVRPRWVYSMPPTLPRLGPSAPPRAPVFLPGRLVATECRQYAGDAVEAGVLRPHGRAGSRRRNGDRDVGEGDRLAFLSKGGSDIA